MILQYDRCAPTLYTDWINGVVARNDTRLKRNLTSSSVDRWKIYHVTLMSPDNPAFMSATRIHCFYENDELSEAESMRSTLFSSVSLEKLMGSLAGGSPYTYQLFHDPIDVARVTPPFTWSASEAEIWKERFIRYGPSYTRL
ncbi:hypothetical protein SEA_GODONK_39 [Gordonia phage GodonK]|uniref:Uncharacterized protein n=1 Tax=Gordonia phage GodonK TaxID=2562192 RepID=A0A4D6E1Z8_9CAUD|nr:hypothetical protein HOV33_gp039 [Gordonia phage GodonK]QBZ72658.1 hypothetical protein SEA_GODONK_39 [Gordonia phage GodonK]